MKLLLTKYVIVITYCTALYAMIVLYDLHKQDLVFGNNHYLAALNDKVSLLKKAPSPKIIFIGGSNLAFGVDSRLIAQALDMSVVNMGLHTGLGLNLLFNIVSKNAKENDVVVLCPEYEYISGNLFYGDQTLLSSFHYYPDGVSCITGFAQLYHIVATNIARNKNVRSSILSDIHSSNKKMTGSNPLEVLLTSVYSRRAFNGYGDIIAHLQQGKMNFVNNKIDDNISYEVLGEINKLKLALTQKKVKFIMLYPCMPESRFETYKEQLDFIDSKLKRFDLIGTLRPQDYVYQDNDFFDSCYHLNSNGRHKRTLRLINDIKTAYHPLLTRTGRPA